MTEANPGRDLEARTGSRDLGGIPLPGSLCSAQFAQLAFLCPAPRNRQPKGSTTSSELGPTTAILSQENAPNTPLHANRKEAISAEGPSSQMTLARVKLAQKENQPAQEPPRIR